MSKDYLKKLLKYMKEVYPIEKAIKHLKDRRINPKYSTAGHPPSAFWFADKNTKF